MLLICGLPLVFDLDLELGLNFLLGLGVVFVGVVTVVVLVSLVSMVVCCGLGVVVSACCSFCDLCDDL